MRRIGLLALFLAALAPAAQDKFEYWPGAVYDPAIPTFRKVLGYETGERISWHANLVKYLEALAAAAPDRVKVFEYAKTWEGRRLVCAAISAKENIRRLDQIRAAMQKLADPRRTPEAEARKLMAGLPSVIWLAYGVHGNELSSPEASLLTAYHLLAARNDKMVQDILANVVVLIDPDQNPDGHDRFVHNFEQNEGIEPDPSPLAAEHSEPWPSGRVNHYYFDLNRDWFALTQAETRGRVRLMLEWFPQVCVDLHEMGADSTYYFAPGALPFNPYLTKFQREGFDTFGKNNARWFDQFGFSYFIREVFDEFFPGYGTSWPSLHGAIAMTYEQASSRGLLMRRTDETLLRFRDTVRNHFVASLSTAEASARNREKLLGEFYQYRSTAIQEGSTEPVREYILPARGDKSAVDKLAALMVSLGAEVKRASAPFRNGDKEFPSGSYVIPLVQPAKRLVRTLLDPNIPMEEHFVKEQERRRKKNLPDEIYDVTAWNLALMFNVECISASEASRGSFTPAGDRTPPGAVAGDNATVAYLAPWGTLASGRLLAASLRSDLRVWSADKPFTLGGRKYPSGTLIFKVKENAASLAEALAKLAVSTGAEIVGINSSWVDDGISLGSNHVVPMRKPTIALAWDTPASPLSAGWTRYVLERQYDYPVTPVRTRQLASAGLHRFDVVILPEPSGSYMDTLGAAGVKRLKDWVTDGGTLVGLGDSVAFLADSKVGLLSISRENLAKPVEPGKPPEQKETAPAKPDAQAPARVPGKLLTSETEYEKALQPEAEPPDSVAGVILKARVDSDHWLGAGLSGTVNAVVVGREIFTPIKLDKGVNVATFLGPDQLLQSGYLWEENRKQFAYKPLAVAQPDGRGVVIGFTADPNFRAYVDGLNVLFLNAVFRGPAHARPAP